MKLVRTSNLQANMVIAQPIYDDRGRVLIREGISLTNTMIKRLINHGIAYVYVKSKLLENIQIDTGIDQQVRVDATNQIKQTFKEFKNIQQTVNAYLLMSKQNELGKVVKNILTEINQFDQAISLLTDILIADDYTFQHSINVTIYSLSIGKKLNLNEDALLELGTGALLHDLGKIFIDQKILKKSGKLTTAEFAEVKRHTKLGFEFLRDKTDFPLVIAHCAYQHHERLNGSGYPRNLVGEEIHPYAQIIAIADVFDAVTSHRIYREAMLPHEGLEILYAGAGELFNQKMVEAFRNSVIAYPNGLTVQLNDKRVGVVVKQTKVCDRPIVLITEENNNQLTTPYKIDLSKQVNITITATHV